MRTRAFRFIGILFVSVATLAACDDSSSSPSGGNFSFDGGNVQYVPPDSGTSPTSEAGAPDGSTSDADSGNPDGGGSGPCTVTLSGDVTKTLSCTLNAVYDVSSGNAGVSLSVGSEVTMAFTATGELTAGTYGWAESVDQGGVVFEGGASAWTVNKTDAIGSSQFVISSVATTFQGASGKVYAVHGTVTASLNAANDAGAGVTLSATF
jgi:hypothetical protein